MGTHYLLLKHIWSKISMTRDLNLYQLVFTSPVFTLLASKLARPALLLGQLGYRCRQVEQGLQILTNIKIYIPIKVLIRPYRLKCATRNIWVYRVVSPILGCIQNFGR